MENIFFCLPPIPMNPKKRPSLLSYLIRAPFYVGFLVVLYFLGASCFGRLDGFALSLGLPAAAVKISAYFLIGLFAAACVLMLVHYFSRHD